MQWNSRVRSLFLQSWLLGAAYDRHHGLELHGEVMACTYEYVRVMWSMHDRSRSIEHIPSSWCLMLYTKVYATSLPFWFVIHALYWRRTRERRERERERVCVSVAVLYQQYSMQHHDKDLCLTIERFHGVWDDMFLSEFKVRSATRTKMTVNCFPREDVAEFLRSRGKGESERNADEILIEIIDNR